MLQPTRTKYRKAHKGRIHGKASRANLMNYGAFGLKALEPDRVISKQIEAARVALNKVYEKDKEEYGLEYFLIYQYLRNRLKLEWEKEKVHQNIMHVE